MGKLQNHHQLSIVLGKYRGGRWKSWGRLGGGRYNALRRSLAEASGFIFIVHLSRRLLLKDQGFFSERLSPPESGEGKEMVGPGLAQPAAFGPYLWRGHSPKFLGSVSSELFCSEAHGHLPLTPGCGQIGLR